MQEPNDVDLAERALAALYSHRRVACITAFIPEPHILFSVAHAVSIGRPAASAALRAGACPWPAGRTQPKTNSSMSSPFRPARPTAARIAVAPRRAEVRFLKSP